MIKGDANLTLVPRLEPIPFPSAARQPGAEIGDKGEEGSHIGRLDDALVLAIGKPLPDLRQPFLADRRPLGSGGVSQGSLLAGREAAANTAKPRLVMPQRRPPLAAKPRGSTHSNE